MQTVAERDGDEWILNGTKQWITNGPYADFAQVFARTSPQEEAGRYGGITCFIVESDEWELGSLNNTPAQIGQQAELRFDDVRIPTGRVLGEVGNAFYDAMEFLSLGRLELGAQAVGLTKHVLDRSTEYAREREAFGQSIGNFQQISSKIARGRANRYAADSAGLRCAWAMDRDRSVVEGRRSSSGSQPRPTGTPQTLPFRFTVETVSARSTASWITSTTRDSCGSSRGRTNCSSTR